MKMKVFTGLLFFFLMSIIISCNTKSTNQPASVIDTEQVKKDIQAKENEFAETYNSGILKNIGYYADDAISFSQNSPPEVGKEAIIKFFKAHMDSLSVHDKISFKTNEVFVSNDGNQVVEIGYFKLVDTLNNVVNSGNYMTLFIKRDGKYLSLRDMSVSDIPLE